MTFYVFCAQRHQVSVRTITKLGHSCDYMCTIVLGGGANVCYLCAVVYLAFCYSASVIGLKQLKSLFKK